MSASVENATPRPKCAGTDATSTPPQTIIHEYEAPGGEPFPSFLERLRATAMMLHVDAQAGTHPDYVYPSLPRV